MERTIPTGFVLSHRCYDNRGPGAGCALRRPLTRMRQSGRASVEADSIRRRRALVADALVTFGPAGSLRPSAFYDKEPDCAGVDCCCWGDDERRPAIAAGGRGNVVDVSASDNTPAGDSSDNSRLLVVCSCDGGHTWSLPADPAPGLPSKRWTPIALSFEPSR